MAGGMKQPGKTVAEAAAPVEPAVADTFKQTSAQQGPVHPSTSEEVSMAGRMKQPRKTVVEAAASVEPAVTQTSAQQGPVHPSTSEEVSMAGGMKQPGKTVAEAAAPVEPAVADTFKQTSAQQGPVHPSTSEEVSMAGRMKQPRKTVVEAAASVEPAVTQTSAQQGPVHPSTSEEVSMAGGMKQPGKTVAEAAAPVEPAVADTLKQTSAQHGPVHSSTSEKVSKAGGMKQPWWKAPELVVPVPDFKSRDPTRPSVARSVTQVSQGVSKAAGLDNTKVPEALKQSSVPQSVQPPNPEQARAVDNLKPPLQRGILQPFASRSGSSTESQVQLPSNPKGPFDHHFQQSGLRKGGLGYEMSQPVVNQASKVLQESPKFGNDMTDMTDTHIPSQPRIGRVGSLPEPYQRPRGPGILKKAKTESFVERPKTLRFAAEAEIREISPCSPCSPCSPSPLAQAVVVGTPVDPGYIQWRQWEHRSAALSADKPGPFGVLPPKTGSAATSWATSSARPLEGDILQRGRSRSMSLLPDLPEPPSEKGAPVSKEPDFEAASKQAPEAWQGHQTPEKPQAPQATQESRFHNPKEMIGTSQASASNSQAGFKVRVEHRGPQEGHNASSECQASSTPSTPSVPSQSSASAASSFLVWKKPSTCEHGPTSMRSSASSVQSFGVSDQGNQGNQRNHGSQNPIATIAQYFYQITLPSGLEEAELHGSTSQAAPALQTTVNCSNELTEMYTRHRGSHRSRKSHRRPEQTATATPSPPQCGVRENISASPPDDFKVPKAAWTCIES